MPDDKSQIALEGIEDAHMRCFLETYEQAWADPKSGRLAKLWASDGEMMHPEFTEPVQGRDAVMNYLKAMLEIAPDLKVRPLAAAVNGKNLFIHFQSEGTFAGKRIVWEGVDHFKLHGEQAVWGAGYFDTTAIRQALSDSGISVEIEGVA